MDPVSFEKVKPKNVPFPLPAISGNQTQALKMSFENNTVEGWVQDTGEWYIKGVVTHSRLLCATYELGIKLGRGDPACLNVQWLTEVAFGTMRRQCNSTPITHVGGGEAPAFQSALAQATCVQVVVKCTGKC